MINVKYEGKIMGTEVGKSQVHKLRLDISRDALSRLFALKTPGPSEGNEVKIHTEILVSELKNTEERNKIVNKVVEFFIGNHLSIDTLRRGKMAKWATKLNIEWLIGVITKYGNANLIFLSHLYEMLENDGLALQLLNDSIKIKPSISAYRRRAHIFHRVNDYAAEIEDLKILLGMVNDVMHPVILTQLASAHQLRNQLDEALRCINSSLEEQKQKPSWEQCLIKGKILNGMNRIEEALSIIEQGLEIKENNELLFEQINSLYRAQRFETAYAMLQKIKAGNPADEHMIAFFHRVTGEGMYDRTNDIHYLQVALDACREKNDTFNRLSKRYKEHTERKEEKSPSRWRDKSHQRKRSPSRERRKRSPSRERRKRSPSRERRKRSPSRDRSPSPRRDRSPVRGDRFLDASQLATEICKLGQSFKEYRGILIKNNVTSRLLRAGNAVQRLTDIGIKRIHAIVIVSTFV